MKKIVITGLTASLVGIFACAQDAPREAAGQTSEALGEYECTSVCIPDTSAGDDPSRCGPPEMAVPAFSASKSVANVLFDGCRSTPTIDYLPPDSYATSERACPMQGILQLPHPRGWEPNFTVVPQTLPTDQTTCEQTWTTATVWLQDQFGNWSKLGHQDFNWQGKWRTPPGGTGGHCDIGPWIYGQVPFSVQGDLAQYQNIRVVGAARRDIPNGKGGVIPVQMPVRISAWNTCIW
jgi:hypothetical protein